MRDGKAALHTYCKTLDEAIEARDAFLVSEWDISG